MRCSLLTLSCYVDDELDARRRGEMDAHLVACARCRGGLTHLREEMGRIGALAPVTVPDRSARALMEAVGVLAPGDVLPPLTTPRAFATDDDAPPWLAGQAGPALPWTAPPRQPRALSVVHEEATIHLHGTITPLRRDEFGGVPAVPFDMQQLRTALPVVLRPGAPSPPGTSADSASTPAGDEDASPASPAARRTETPLPPPSTPPLPPMPFDPLRRERLLSGLVGIDSTPQTPAWWAPTDPEPAAEPSGERDPAPAAGDPPPPADRPSAAGDSEVAVWTSEPSAGAPPAPEYPMTDEDLLAEPEPVEHLGGPVPAPKPGLFERFKERIAVRRALSGAFHDDYDDSVEVVSGTGAPLRPHGRGELGRRRSDALRPAESITAGAPPSPATAPGMSAPAPRRELGLREVLAPPARPSSLEPVRPTRAPTSGITTSSRGIVEVEPLGARSGRDPWSLLTPLPEDAPVRVPRGRELSPSEARDGRRMLTMVVGGLAAIMVVGLISGRISTTIPSPTSTATTQPAGGTTAQVPVVPPLTPQQQPTAAAPQASAAAPAPASQAPAPAPAPVQQAGPVAIGSGGTGWKVGDFRYGGHSTFYRVVVDLGPAGTAAPAASPTVTVANEDATHILVTLDGTAPADSAPTPPAQSGISGIQLVSNAHSGSTVYRLTLTHAASAHASLIAGPMRLILDIS